MTSHGRAREYEQARPGWAATASMGRHARGAERCPEHGLRPVTCCPLVCVSQGHDGDQACDRHEVGSSEEIGMAVGV